MGNQTSPVYFPLLKQKWSQDPSLKFIDQSTQRKKSARKNRIRLAYLPIDDGAACDGAAAIAASINLVSFATLPQEFFGGKFNFCEFHKPITDLRR